MSETDDAVAILTRNNLLIVDELRETRALTQTIVAQLGRICDQNAEILVQMGQLRRDSESSIRVVKEQLRDVVKRIEPIEKDYYTRRSGTG